MSQKLSKEQQIKNLKGKISDTELRKKIGDLYGVKKTQRNQIFNDLFPANYTLKVDTLGEVKGFEKNLKNMIKNAIVDNIKQSGTNKKSSFKTEDKEEEIFQKEPAFKHNGNEGTAEVIDTNVKTLDELLKVCNVNLDEWTVERYIVNKWATARKNKINNVTYTDGVADGKIRDDGGMTVQPLYQVKAWLVRRKEVKDRITIVNELKKALNEIPVKSFEVSPERTGYLYEIAIPDIHMGKLVWKDEVHNGENYNATVAANLFKKAVATLISRIDITKVSRILLPIGNDFYNSDNAAGTTTAGTKMTEDSRWQDTFIKGTKLVTEVVEYLAKLAPVDVVIISGNHDMERAFYLGEYISAWFKNHPSVTVNNSPTSRKYYRWNKNLIGMTHGNEEKHADLPLIMATEKPQDWAECTSKHFQIGHTHKKDMEDIKGVQIQTISSLCASDFWHSSKGYVGSQRTAEGLLFDAEEGLIGNYYFRA
jgi:predicted phosphodiesterase